MYQHLGNKGMKVIKTLYETNHLLIYIKVF